MFERFIKPESKREVVPDSEVIPEDESALELEDERIIQRVLEQTKEPDSLTPETKQKNSTPEVVPHRVSTDEEVIEQSKKAANPHGFTELK